MTISPRPISAVHWIVSIVALIVLSFGCFRFVTTSPWPYIAVGVLLLIVSFALPKSIFTSEHSLMRQKGPDMDGLGLITDWDEGKIKGAVHSTLTSQGSAAAMTLISGLLSRFADGQNAQTFTQRTAFLKTQIEYAETWTKLQVARREAERTEQREDIKDDKVGIDKKDVDHALELSDLKHELEKENLKRQLDEARYNRSKVGKEPPPPPPPPSAKEVREMRRVELRATETSIREEMARTQADPLLTDEQRQRKMNALEDRLALVHEELAELL